MTEKEIESKILGYLGSQEAQRQSLKPKKLAAALELRDDDLHAFRNALRELMRQGRVTLGTGGALVLPTQRQASGLLMGTYRHNRKGFGFVIPSDPESHEDLFIPPGENGGAITGDKVSAKVTSQHRREGKTMYEGKIVEIIERTQKNFVGTLAKQGGQWMVLPDGNAFTEAILTPDAASRHVKPGTKVVVEMTTYPETGLAPQGVITEILGQEGEKDVDLRAVIVQHNLPGEHPEEVIEQAREAIVKFNLEQDWGAQRYDLTGEVICTIDPDDAKDYDDAISLNRKDDGNWELGVHIADVPYFVPAGTPLDEEAYLRGNSCYFPGHVIPMLPEMLSNGVCSLQEGVPRLCKSVFITINEDGRPTGAKFANTVIKSAKRLRYREAQALIDNEEEIFHPDGNKRKADYEPKVVKLLHDMNALAKRIQKRRLADGQLVLNLPEVELVLDEQGAVVGTRREDTSFTHTLIEMFMVEANEAVARLFDSLDVPFIRRVHPEPEVESSERLRHFVEVAGHRLPKQLDRKALQQLLASVRDKPEEFAINLAVLKSLSRAEYSPQKLGHYALASEHYTHFTSPIRRYADLLVHRMLDEYLAARDAKKPAGMPKGGRKREKVELENVIDYNDLVTIGKHISFTERRADDAERELRQVKILTLMKERIGEQFMGVITGITNFGIFVQIQEYLIDGLIRYEDLLDDWWDVDERAGRVRGQRTGQVIGIGDVAKVTIVNVDLARRELDLVVAELMRKAGKPAEGGAGRGKAPPSDGRGPRGGGSKRHGSPPDQQQGHRRRPAGAHGGPRHKMEQKRRGGGQRRGGR